MKEESLEERERRLRFRKYRMVRKIEKPVEPLSELRKRVEAADEERRRLAQIRPKSPDGRETMFKLEKPMTAEERKSRIQAQNEKRRTMFMSEQNLKEMEAEQQRLKELEMMQQKEAQIARHKKEKEKARKGMSYHKMIQNQQMKWITVMFAAFVQQDFIEKVRYKTMANDEFMAITRLPIEKLRRRARTSYLYQRALDIALLEANPSFSESMVFLQSWTQLRLRVVRRRRAAKTLMEVLTAWSTAGQLLLSLRKYHFCCRRIQGWWQRKRARMIDIRESVKAVWRAEEQDIVHEELMKQDQKGFKRPKPTGPEDPGKKKVFTKGLSMAERMSLMTTKNEVVEDFLAHELRIRRYKILTKVLLWRVHMDEYYDQVENWRMSMEARVVMREREKEDANPDPPPIMPGCPTHIPNDDEVRELVKKCRVNPSYRAPLPKPASDNEKELEEQRRFTAKFAPSSKEGHRPAVAVKLSARDYMPKIVELERFGLVPNLAPLEDPLPWVLGGTKPKITAHR
jgi:hypothetical protein